MFTVCDAFDVCMFVCLCITQCIDIMSVEELIRAVKSNQTAEVVRLLDEEDVDVNCEDEEVSLVYCCL